MSLAWISNLAAGILNSILAFFMALLPERIKGKRRFAGLASNAAHVISGLAECALALALFVYGYDQFVGGLSAGASQALAAKNAQAISDAQFRGIGAFAFVLYLMHPFSIISFYMFIEGIVRAFAAGLTGHRHGIGFFWAIDRIALLARTKCKAAAHRKRLGPAEPDCIINDAAAGTLVLISIEDKPWRERQAAQHGDDFYILSAKNFVPTGKHHRYRYTFRRMRPGESIRGTLVVLPRIKTA